MHVVIAGATEVAFTIAELLMRDHNVVLLAESLEGTARLERMDVRTLQGRATSSHSLREAGIHGCGVFVAATDHDESNLVACITARHVGARRTICLLNQPALLTTDERDETLAASLGIDAIVRPSEQLAREVVRIVITPGALDAENFLSGKVRLLRHVVEEGAPLTGSPVVDLKLPANVVLVMRRRGDQVEIPSGQTSFVAGDKVTAMGTPRGVHQLLYRFLRNSRHGADREAAVIVGGGAVGLAVALGLESHGWRVKVIEASGARCEEIAPKVQGLVVQGDGTDLDLLEEEAVGTWPVLVAVTNNDEKNLLVSLIARSLGVQRIITRADRLANERVFERVGIDVVRSARGAAIRKVVRDVVGATTAIRAELEHGDVQVIEVVVPPGFSPTPLRALHTDIFALVGAISRGDEVIIPRGPTEIQSGDHLLVFTSQADRERARLLFTGGG